MAAPKTPESFTLNKGHENGQSNMKSPMSASFNGNSDAFKSPTLGTSNNVERVEAQELRNRNKNSSPYKFGTVA